MKTGILVGIPFTTSPAPIQQVFRSIDGIDIAGLGRPVAFLFVLDALRDPGTAKELERRMASSKLEAMMLGNRQSLGFAGCANRIFDFARDQQRDVILLSPDLVLLPGALEELAEVAASDPMIGFVSPRSNAGTIASLPNLSSSESPVSAFEMLRPRLPRVAYVPTAPASCLFVKLQMVQEFGGFTSIVGDSMEQSDLIGRANRCGYRAAIANHAFAYRPDETGEEPGAPGQTSTASFEAEYPDYHRAVGCYLASPAAKALRLISCLAEKPPLPIAFDVSNYGRRRDGTSEYGTRLIASFAARFASKYRIHAICAPAAWEDHGFAAMEGVTRSPIESATPFAAVIRPSQPFDLPSVALGPSRGAVSIVSMLDCIAYDCLDIRPPELESLWDFVLRYSDVVIYPSEFTRAQFARRFAGTEQGRHIVSVPSTDIDEYAPSDITHPGEYLLVVGNSFAHKSVRETVDALRQALPAEKLKVLGVKLPEHPSLESHESGALRPSLVDDLFAGAKAVIFPSHYEGFGFPVLHALGHRRPVFVRDLPVYAEIRARVAAPDNIHVFATGDELLRLLTPETFTWKDDFHAVEDVGWDRAARELETALDRALDEAKVPNIERRLEQLALLEAAIGGPHHRVQQLEERIKGFETSSSWRITAPLRKLRGLFS